MTTDGSALPVADDTQLRDALESLSRLILGEGQQGLENMLGHVADFAVQAIPGASGAGLTLLELQRDDLVVAGAEFVREIDAVQHGMGEGPCMEAIQTRRTVVSGALGADPRWGLFGTRAHELGVRSALSLPLTSDQAVLGALNVYSYEENAFDERAVELGELFAMPAAVSVQNAQLLATARRMAENLQAALTSRAVIDQAAGILMSRHGFNAEEAIERLKTMSQAGNRRVSAVAGQLVDDAVIRARARHSGNPS